MRIDRHVPALEQLREGADVVEMTMGEDDRLGPRALRKRSSAVSTMVPAAPCRPASISTQEAGLP
jgi:hypothetical protein